MTFIGESPTIQAVRERLERLLQQMTGARRAPVVLLEGETGTGKGLVARQLHQRGPRPKGPFVDVNCAAIPETLLEAELFGFERGAFTDARHAKPGLFQAAHGGTLFLDEIGLLPLGLQAKLLKVIEERTVRRLGSTQATPADVWIIAASNETLSQAVSAGRVRADLYHRLAGFVVHMPPLRERGEDIRLLAEHFLNETCTQYGLVPKHLSPEAVAALRRYSWPGNIRELNNTIERAVVLTDGLEVEVQSLELPDSPSSEMLSTTQPALRSAIAGFERARLLAALEGARWNISFAADGLGIPRNTLRYRMARYGLTPPGSSPRRRRLGRLESLPLSKSVFGAVPSPASTSETTREERQLAWVHVAFASTSSVSAVAERVVQLMLDKVAVFGGHTERVTAETILAVFGLDPAEDALRRAAHAAFAMRRAGDGILGSASSPFRMKLVVDFTSCVVEGSEGVRHVAPESLHAASEELTRLSRSSEGPDVVASPDAAQALERWFEIVPVSDGSRVWRVLRPDGGGFRGRLRRGSRCFVGRDQELEWLRHRVAQVAQGCGQVVCLISEPGGGKSRLLYEFCQQLSGQAATYLEGRCVSYGGGIPYLPVRDLLRRIWHLDEADPPDMVTARIRQYLALAGTADAYRPYLLHLFGLANATDEMAGLTPEAIKRRTFEAVRQVILNHVTPVVLAMEDLHWIDKTSEDFLMSVVESTRSMPLLFVGTYRPGYRPPWIDRSYASQLALAPLSRIDSRALVRAMAPERDIPEAALETIVVRGEGNPFFLEELALAAPEVAQSEGGRVIPQTIGEVLTARLDRLTDRERRVLEAAAVLGREVPVQVLDAMLGAPADLADRLQDLVRLEVLDERPDSERRGFGFRHALIQEVTYDRLLTAAGRIALHAAAGKALESLYADRIEEVLDRLAYHYAKTSETQVAVTYLSRFAEKATASYSLVEALSALQEALAHADRLSEPLQRDRAIVMLATKRAFVLVLLGKFQAALDGLMSCAGRVDLLDDPIVTGPYYLWLGLVHAHMGNHPEAIGHANRCIEIATRAGDRSTLGVAQVQLSIDYFFLGQHRRGVDHARRGVGLLDERLDAWWSAHAYWLLAWNLVALGEFEAADSSAAMMATIGDRAAEPRLQAYALSTRGWIAALRQDPDMARMLSERAEALAPDPLCRAVVVMLSAYCKMASGGSRDAVAGLRQAVAAFQSFHFKEMEVWGHAWLSEALLDMGDCPAAEQEASEALSRYPGIGFAYAIGVAQRVQGRIALLSKCTALADEHLSKAVATFDSIEACHEVSRTRVHMGQEGGPPDADDAPTGHPSPSK